jgi:hypothetical protein
MPVSISPDRLADFGRLSLKHGAHRDFEQGMCAMEAAAYIANEPHSASPACVCSVLTSFMVGWNDGLPSDEDRDRLLKPLIPRLLGTAGDGHADERSWLAIDWLIRVYTPAWLATVPALVEHADRLRALPPVLAMENVTRAMEVITPARKDAAAAWAAARTAAGDAAWDAARTAAWDAARDAAGDAARTAAGDAAWAAAGDAARDAARAAAWDAARDAAGAAAGDAARAAARDAAWDAAGDALKPTVTALQASASLLAENMIALGEGQRSALPA